jgi:hypothetical protein
MVGHLNVQERLVSKPLKYLPDSARPEGDHQNSIYGWLVGGIWKRKSGWSKPDQGNTQLINN